MKTRAFMLVAMVCLASALRLAGQSFHADETTKLKTFLRQKSAVEGKANYEPRCRASHGATTAG